MRISAIAATSRTVGLIVLGLFTALTQATGQAQAPAVPSLLLPADASARVPAAVLGRLDTLQARATRANLPALAGDAFDVEVTAGRTLQARLDRRENHRNGAKTWAGHVVGEPLSTVTVVEMNGVLQGSIRTLQAAYSIEPAAGGAFHVVRQVDADATGVELDPLAASVAMSPPAGDLPPVAGDDSSTFDIVVFYNQAARDVAGSDLAVQTRIALGVSETNTAYANSGVVPRLRLVGAELVSYTESTDLSTDLARFAGTADGFIDAVHTRRDQLGADLAMLVVGATAGGACGVGYVMTSLSASFASNAFTVTAYPCISPNYTFAHELGHNMGSAHAPEDGAVQGSLYPYSFGYKNPSNLFRTVMAYNCTAGCPRLLHFSNPGVSYGGATTGTSGQHDNARSLNNAANTIANWRQAVAGGGGTPPTITALSNATISEDTATTPMGFTIGDAETAAASLSVTAASSNAALVPNTGAALALGGTGASRTLVVTPAAQQFGTATITVTVNDGTHSTSRTFTLAVSSVPDAPTISAIGAQTTPEDSPRLVSFTVGDLDTSLSALVVQGASSNPTLVPAGAFVFGGSGAARTVTISPAADQFGTATITLTVGDGGLTTPSSFTLSVTAENDAPVFAPGTPTAVSTLAGAATSFPVTVTDVDATGPGLSLAGTTTNASLLPSISVPPTGSTSSSRTFMVTLTPAAGMTGTADVTLAAGDGTAAVTRLVTVSVTSTPGPPDAPVTLSTVVTGSALQLNWTPASTGTLATSYSVEVGTTPGATNVLVQSTSATTLSVPVAAGATYYARVRAVNNTYGTSAPSPEASVTITVFEPTPGKVPQLGASASGRSVTVSWTAPTTGDPVTNYVLEVGSAPGLADITQFAMGTATSYFAQGVPDGTFWLRMRASNASGSGPPSSELAVVMRATGGCIGLPMAPITQAPTVAGSQVTLRWTRADEGATPISYVVVAGSAPGLSDVAALDLDSPATSVSGSVPDGAYFVRIGARSRCGMGPLSNEVPLVVGGSSPG